MTGDSEAMRPDGLDRRRLQDQLRQQLVRLETALPGSPEWDAAKTAVEELQELVARSDGATLEEASLEEEV